ncbi:TnsD family Tn7-like transposition protein [Paraburkholderia susongensis]
MSRNLATVPPILPDETAPSYLRRLSEANGCFSSRRAASEALHAAWRKMRHDLPLYLGELAEAASVACGDSDSLLQEHSSWNYSIVGLTDDAREGLRVRLSTAPHGCVRPNRLPLAFESAEPTGRYCPVCALEDRRVFGVVYVHRQHMVPFVTRCYLHHAWLYSERPGDAQIDVMSRVPCGGPSYINSCTFSETCAGLLQNQREAQFRSLAPPRLVALGYITPANRVRFNSLVTDIASAFEHGFEDTRLTQLATDHEQIQRWLRSSIRTNRNTHPVYCVLLHIFLTRAGARKRKVVVSTTPKARTKLDDAMVCNMVQCGRSLRSVAKELQVDSASLRPILDRQNINYRRASRRINESLATTVSARLESGNAIDVIASEVGVSIPTVYRFLQAHPTTALARSNRLVEGHREHCCQQLSSAKTRQEARDRFPAEWAWLYRHDRECLFTFLDGFASAVAQRCVEQVKVAPALATAAYRAANVDSNADSRPLRRTGLQLAARAGISDYAFDRVEEMLGPISESSRQYAFRRIVWAAANVNRGIYASPWRLAKAAHVRVETVSDVLAQGNYGGSRPK